MLLQSWCSRHRDAASLCRVLTGKPKLQGPRERWFTWCQMLPAGAGSPGWMLDASGRVLTPPFHFHSSNTQVLGANHCPARPVWLVCGLAELLGLHQGAGVPIKLPPRC